MKPGTFDVILYSTITIVFCIILAALAVPVEGLIVVALACIGMIILSVRRDNGQGGPE